MVLQSPCSVCGKSVKNNQAAIFSDSCTLWSHSKCNGISPPAYNNLQSSNEDWFCFKFFNNALPPENVFIDKPQTYAPTELVTKQPIISQEMKTVLSQ